MVFLSCYREGPRDDELCGEERGPSEVLAGTLRGQIMPKFCQEDTGIGREP